MADPSDSSLAFFSKATADQWSYVLGLYGDVLRVKAASRNTKKGGPEELIKLDTWFQEQLPKIIHSRKDPHIIHEELVQITRWKLMRGKFRPRLIDLVRINTETAVLQTSKKAFRKLSHGNNLSSAISAMTTLKGIGPATASAVLVAAYPEYAPFMADESMLSTPGVEATDYTLAEYMNYAEQIKSCTERLKANDAEAKWTPHKVEMSLWTHYLARELKPELLDDMPLPGQRSSKNLDSNPSSTVESETHVHDHPKIETEEHKITSTTLTSANGKEPCIDDNSNFSVPSLEDGIKSDNDSNFLTGDSSRNTGNGTVSTSDSKELESEDTNGNLQRKLMVDSNGSLMANVGDDNDNAVDGVEEPAFKKQRTCTDDLISPSDGHNEVIPEIPVAEINAPPVAAAVPL